MHYIYEIKNSITNKRYIGRTNNPRKRKSEHFTQLRNNKHNNVYLQRAANKYGLDKFEFTILHECESIEDVIKLESTYLNSTEDLYNLSRMAAGGDNTSYHPNNKQIREKIGEASKRFWASLSPEERKRRSEAISGKNNPNYGNYGPNNYKMSEELKQHLREIMKGRVISEETRRRISQSKKGSIPWNKGKKTGPLSEEHRALMSRQRKGIENVRAQIPVICENVYFKSKTQAAEAYQITPSGIEIRVNSNSDKFKDFYLFDASIHDIKDYKIYDPNTFSSKLVGKSFIKYKDSKIYCEGNIFTLEEACAFYGRCANTIRNRCLSDKSQWKEFYYLNAKDDNY